MKNKDKIDLKTKLEIAIESGMQLIPYVGGVLTTAYFGTKQAKEFERIKRFYSELSEELTNVKDKIVSMDSQYEDGLISLIEQLNYKVEREHQEEKIKYFKNYMKSILIEPVSNINYDKRKVFLDIIENSTLIECDILVKLNSIYGKWVQVRYITHKNYDKYAIIGAINRLKSYGFLKTRQEDILVGGVDSNVLSELISISDYGREFVEFIIK